MAEKEVLPRLVFVSSSYPSKETVAATSSYKIDVRLDKICDVISQRTVKCRSTSPPNNNNNNIKRISQDL